MLGGVRDSPTVYCRCCGKGHHQGCKALAQGMTKAEFALRSKRQQEGESSRILYDWVCDVCSSCDVCMQPGDVLLLRCDMCLRRVHSLCLPTIPGTDILAAVVRAEEQGVPLPRIWRCEECCPRSCSLCDRVVGKEVVTCRTCKWTYHTGCVREKWGMVVLAGDQGFRCKTCPSESCDACGRAAPDDFGTAICGTCGKAWHKDCLAAAEQPECDLRFIWRCKGCAAHDMTISKRGVGRIARYM
ncbi:hypothetical protein AURDEDRAFT_178069 [Auricularia subglabra TFB-10046 SS5]|uniref:PHD-type domain-containing protein n=1 Tax=Auricularia subglabra (strain TFB-10046 / SS5) TaxID=717982 RepID=J0CRE9_AURST|nr:hypothetical protein AURDEDRAFT_178069 [Auricularia subglabra TFB-10046 SS5]